MVAPNDVTFAIRASRQQLGPDLRSAERDIAESARRATQQANTIARQNPFQLSIDSKTTGDNVSREIGRILQQVREEAKQKKLQIDIEARLVPTQNLDKLETERFKQTANVPAFGEAAEASKSFLGTTSELFHTIGKVARVFTIIEASIASAELGVAGTKLITAAIAGDYERQVKAAKGAEDAVKAIPFVGDRILSIGATINKYTIDLVTHESEYVEKIKKATIEEEKHTEVLIKRVGHQKDAIAAATSLVEGLGTKTDPGMSAEQAAAKRVADQRKALAEALQKEGLTSRGGLSETGKALQIQGNKQIQFDINTEYEARHTKELQLGSTIRESRLRIADEVNAAEVEALEEQNRQKLEAAQKIGAEATRQQREANDLAMAALEQRQARERDKAIRDLGFNASQAEARGIGPMAAFQASQAAARRPFDESLEFEKDAQKRIAISLSRDRTMAANQIVESRRVHDAVIDIQNDIHEKTLRAAGNTYQADVESFTNAMDQKIRAAATAEERITLIQQKEAGLRDMEAQRAKQREDLASQTHELFLRRHGFGNEADVNEILRSARDQMKAAEGDKATQEEIIANTEERIRGIKPDIREATVTSAASAFRSNIFGGSPNQDKLLAVQQKALDQLTIIANNAGVARVI